MNDRGGGPPVALLVFFGIAAYLAACLGGIYYLTGVILEKDGFNGILAGTLIGVAAAALLSGLGASLAKRIGATEQSRSGWTVLMAAALVLATALFVKLCLVPTLRQNPKAYYAPPDTQYQVTYASGRQEIKTGAQIGLEKWGWLVGLYFSMSLVAGLISLYGLGSSLLEWKKALVKPVGQV